MRRLVLAVVCVVFLGSQAVAQLQEDRLEPDEIGIGDLDQVVTPATSYVGTASCAACHASAFRTWMGTRHARAWVVMRSRIAMKIAMRAGTTTEMPGFSAICMQCHATGHNVPAAYREPDFRMGEGVTCEKCHGPGRRHVDAAEADDWSKGTHMRVPAKEFCQTCHKAKNTHAMECSACHGNREEHVAMHTEASPASARVMSVFEGNRCFVCHEPDASHAFLLERRAFHIEEAWKRIEHKNGDEKSGKE